MPLIVFLSSITVTLFTKHQEAGLMVDPSIQDVVVRSEAFERYR
jgi:hypothetical protein